MIFHIIVIMKTLFVLLFSVTIITASDENKDFASTSFYYDASDGAGSSGTTGVFDPPTYATDTTITNMCSFEFGLHFRRKVPDILEFIKLAIAKWERKDLIFTQHILHYYNGLSKKLDPAKILPPGIYCFEYVAENTPVSQEYSYSTQEIEDSTPKFQDARSLCLYELQLFGESNDEALQYGFYNMKFPLFLMHSEAKTDPETMAMYFIDPKGSFDFKGDYMKHLMENVKFDPDTISPEEFCDGRK